MMSLNTSSEHTHEADDMGKRQFAYAALGALLLTSSLGCNAARSVDTQAQQVSTAQTDPSYSVIVAPLSLDACSMAVDDMSLEAGTVGAWLAQQCDYRVTGAWCEEDAVCAVQQVLDTGDFTGDGR